MMATMLSMFGRVGVFELLEPRLFLSTTMFREGGGTGFTNTPFDDAQIVSATDVPNGTNAAGIAVGGSPTNYGLLGINDLFALLPKNAAGQVINVSQAKLHLFRYDTGTSASTISVFRATTDWMTGAAGTNEADVTFQHSDKSADVSWAAGNFGIGDYNPAGVTTNFVSGVDQEVVIDITSLVQAMYQSGVNDGFVISASDAISFRPGESAVRGLRPALEITYTYVDAAHTLTVNSGSGDGSYAPGELVGVAADAAPQGYMFDRWTGDTTGLASVTAASTTYTMPNVDAGIFATYIPSSGVVVSTVTGTAATGSTLTISGVNFGTKAVAGPVKYDTFESGTNGAELTGWSLSSSGPIDPTYSNAISHNGSQAGYANFQTQYGCGAYARINLATVYMSYWVYWEHTSGDVSRNMKFGRFSAGQGGDEVHGTPSYGYTQLYETTAEWYTNPDPVTDTIVWSDPITGGSWHRVEMYGKISTIDTADGGRGIWLDNKAVIALDNSFMSYTSNADGNGPLFENALLPFYVAHDVGGGYNIYYDDVYIDSSLARVEIGNAPTWSACTQREVQPASSWSDGSIQITANLGAFSGNTVYVYVIDANNNANEAGYEITIGQTSVANRPPAVDAGTNQSILISGQATLNGTAADDGLPSSPGNMTYTWSKVAGTGNVTFGNASAIDTTATFSAVGEYKLKLSVFDGNQTRTDYVTIYVKDANNRIPVVNLGDSTANNTFGFIDWNSVYLGNYTVYSASGPDGIKGGGTGQYDVVAVSGTTHTYAIGEKVVATWYNDSASQITFTPLVSFTDPDMQNLGATGTWYNMSSVTIPAYGTAIATYTINSSSAGTYSLLNVCRGVNTTTAPLLDKIELEMYNPVTIAATDASASESGGTGTFTVTRAGSTSAALTVNYTVSGTATGGADYNLLGSSITIPAGQASAIITVTPIDDALAENAETVILTLATGANYSIGTPNSATVNIADNEPADITIVATDSSAAEPNDAGTFTVTRSGDISAPLTVNYTVGGTATSGTDYTSLGGSVTIPAGQNTAIITVAPINDNVIESSETVILTLTSGTGYTVGSPAIATVNIADNDSTVSIATTDAMAAEPSDTGTFTVTRSGYTGGDLTVNYTRSGTALSGSDYAAMSGSVTIPAGQASATITVTPVNDDVFESTETLILTLASGTDYVIGSPNNATVNIADDDMAVTTLVNFGASAAANTFGTSWTTVYIGQYTGYVANGPAGITGANTGIYHCVGVSGAAAKQFNIGDQVKVTWYNFGTASQTFTPKISFDDLDYEGTGDTGTWYTMSQITIPAGQSATVTFTIDATTAGTYYNVTTARNTGNIPNVLVDKIELSQTTSVSISATDASAGEPSNTGTFTFTRTNGTAAPLTVNFNVSGTATNGTDYATIGGSVTIPMGQSSATITVTPIDDLILEGNETVILTLASGSGYVLGSPAAATVTIADNDQPTVTLVATDAIAAEPNDTGTFTVTRTGSTTAALTVNYTLGGSATNVNDYASLSGSVVIPIGQASATITVTPVDDAITESTETVILTISTSANYAIGGAGAATVNIADNDTFQITGVSGIINARQTITINGNVFGTGPDAVVFDDFEEGLLDTPILSGAGSAVVGQWDSTAGVVTYSDNDSISGNQALYGDFTTTNSPKAVRDFAVGTNEVFASWWVKIPEIMPGEGNVDGINWKHVWILGATTGDDDILIVFLGPTSQILVSGNCGPTTKYSSWSEGNGFERGDWIRMTFYVKGGTTDGVYRLTMLNGTTGASTVVDMPAGKTWGGSPTPTQYETIGFDAYGRVTAGSTPMFDDTYSASGANARARVEIGNASTYAACTNLSICPPTSWSGTSINTMLNFGSLDTSGPLYLYVIKADGTVSPGYAVTASQAPLANTDTYSVSTSGTLTVPAATGVIANDLDLNGGTLTATKMSDPAHGTVSFSSNGAFTYTPVANYYGPDSFTYCLSDGTNTGNTGTVNISVRQNLVNFGSSAGANTYGTAWTTAFLSNTLGYSSAGPAGILGGTTTNTTYQGISGAARTFNAGEVVYVTWYNNSTSTVKFTPKISFDDPDQYADGVSGTWYDMMPITFAPGQTVTTSYTILTGGLFSRINILRNIGNQSNLLCDKIELG